MYDRFVQCCECNEVSLTSGVLEEKCPHCGCKNLTYGFTYLDERNTLVATLEELPYPTPFTLKDVVRDNIGRG